MIGIVIVSHSPKIADGVKDLIFEMTKGKIKVAAAGGLDDETIGTNPERIYEAIIQVYSRDGVIIFVDLGSALLSTDAAIEMLSDEKRSNIIISESSVVEGAIIGSIEASIGSSLQKVNDVALAAKDLPKR